VLGADFNSGPRKFQSTPPVAGRRCRAVASSARSCRNVSIHAPRCREAMHFLPALIAAGVKFQSTPPVAGRRCLGNHAPQVEPGIVSIHAPRCREAMPECSHEPLFSVTFQSTPPVAGRRCLNAVTTAGRWKVSIHAPRCREAMRDVGIARGVAVLVSIHAPRCREAMLALLLLLGNRHVVSIHAPRCREAMPASSTTSATSLRFNPRPPLPGGDATAATSPTPATAGFQSTPPVAGRRCVLLGAGLVTRPCMFQSTPPVAGRRCPATSMLVTTLAGFNPRPPLPGGDAVIPFKAQRVLAAVSIHAPRCREAMLYDGVKQTRDGLVSIHAPRCREAMLSISPPSRRPRGFNPRPPLPGGDADVRAVHRDHLPAFQSTPPVAGRRCRPASACATPPPSFNPRPPLPGGDARPRGLGAVGSRRFNPRPPLPGGDARASTRPSSASRSFNPRPPLPGGDAADFSEFAKYLPVSIHAPRCREAMPPRLGMRNTATEFQSTPPVAGRRCPCGGRLAWPEVSFQSTPPVAGRRCGAAVYATHPTTVSIHAPRCREAMPAPVAPTVEQRKVSIHAPRCREAMRPEAGDVVAEFGEFQSTPPVAGRRCRTARARSSP